MNPAAARAPVGPDAYDPATLAKKFLRGAMSVMSKELARVCGGDEPDDQAARGLAGACQCIADAIRRIDPAASDAPAEMTHLHEGPFP